MYSVCSHYKGPEQDQLRSPFVPYVRNTAERSIHNFDSQPYIYILDHIGILVQVVSVDIPHANLDPADIAHRVQTKAGL